MISGGAASSIRSMQTNLLRRMSMALFFALALALSACGGSDSDEIADLGPDPATGRRRQARRSGFATKKAAEAALRDLATAADAGTAVSRSRITVSQFLTDWLETIKPRVRETTWVSYRMAVERITRQMSGWPSFSAMKKMEFPSCEYSGLRSKVDVLLICTGWRKSVSITHRSPPAMKATSSPSLLKVTSVAFFSTLR